MPYQPPHLRNGGTGSAPPSDSRDGGSFGGYGRRSDGPRESSSSSRDYGSSFGSRDAARADGARRPEPATNGTSSKASAAPQAVFPEWQPSERALNMSEEQIKEARERLSISVEGETSTSVPLEAFDDMNLHENIMRDIKHKQYDKPTPIQAQGIPIALKGNDVLGCAETGSGKTASFGIPMIQHCLHQRPLRRGDGPMGLVLAPTRELAQQIDREIKDFSRTSRDVRTSIVVGGTNISEQRGELRNGVEIVIATPGRFIDHLQQNNTSLNRVSYVVLDEADRMLDMGFEPQIKEIMLSLPTPHQTLLFSATMPEEIEALAGQYLNKPLRIKVGQVSTPTANVTQALQKTTDTQKLDDVAALLLEESRQAESSGQQMPLTIIFVERKARCDDVAELLRTEGLSALALHGGLSQWEREGALRDFTKGDVRILVATDVASRGLDVKGIAHVINLDLPRQFEDYVHRIGRTGRAGSTGRATSFWTDRDSFVVTQIKKALSELESGNTFAFATGKAARQKEKELAAEFKDKIQTGPSAVVATGGAAVKVDDKFKFMTAPTSNAGAADDAWDD